MIYFWTLFSLLTLAVGGGEASLAYSESQGPHCLELAGSWTGNAPGSELPGSKGDLQGQAGWDGQGSLLLAYAGTESGGQESQVYLRRLDRSTGEWEELGAWREEGSSAIFPSLVVADTEIHLAFLLRSRSGVNRVRYMVSRDGGGRWVLRDFPAGLSANHPQLVRDRRGNLHICFSSSPVNNSPEVLHLFQSLDGGESWSEGRIGPAKGDRRARQPRLVSFGDGTSWLVWLDWESGVARVALCRWSTEDGAWSDPVLVSEIEEEGNLQDPAVLAWGEDVGVFWTRAARGERTVLFDFSSDGGRTWGEDQVLIKRRVELFQAEFVRIEDGALLIWSEGSGPQHRLQNRMGLSQLSGRGARIGGERVFEEVGEIRALTANSGPAGISVATVERLGLQQSIIVYSMADRESELRKCWQSTLDMANDWSMVTLVPEAERLLLLYRESTMAGLHPSLAIRTGQLRLMEFRAPGGDAAGE